MKSIKIVTLVVSFFLLAGLAGKINANSKKIMSEQTVLKGTEKKVQFRCKGIGCSGCTNTITEAIKQLNGIKEVSADVKTKIVKVSFDSEIVSAKEIEKTINDSGYETETVD
ncbi:MAG: cation transporter [Ignavibacteria bacterium]|nr:cation transporter [Ignavibacteria bacterium]